MITNARWRVKAEREGRERKGDSVEAAFCVVTHESIHLPPFVRIRSSPIIAGVSL